MISLKGNQGNLHQDIKVDWAERIEFKDIKFDYCETLEKGHGIEQRRCWVTEEIEWLEKRADWQNLKSVVTKPSEKSSAAKKRLKGGISSAV